LSSALQQIRSYNSALRKSYLTADIILGLEALHRCGYCHGDVKTDNIIIQSHPHREVIAKLADFSGVKSVVARHEESRPDFGTPTWQPPEVILNNPDIDWQLADIYSLGMVIATIWTREGFIPQGGTFLDPQLTYDLDATSKSLWMNTLKTKDDVDPESMINSAYKTTAYTESPHLPVQALISYTLPRCPRDRSTAKDISHHVATPFLMQLGKR
jgi:serine/threonine protein kinase